MWGMTVGTDEGVGKSHAVLCMHNWGHSLQINLVHDAVAGGDDIDVFKCGFGPVYKMKAVVITTILNGSIFLKGVFLKTSVLYRERMVDNQLCGHDWVDLGRIAAFCRNRVSKAGKINQGSLAKNVMTDYTSRKPWKVEVSFALNELTQGSV